MKFLKHKFFPYLAFAWMVFVLAIAFSHQTIHAVRVPAQISPADPFVLHYLNPRPGAIADGGACAQANECQSFLCLSGSCTPRSFSNAKGVPGQLCTDPTQCFSNICAFNGSSAGGSAGKCVGTTTPDHCTYVSQFCNSDAQCCSNSCDPIANRCLPDTIKECGPVGAISATTEACCSKASETAGAKVKCVGSNLDPGAIGERCTDPSQCASNLCDNSHNQCL